MGQRQSSNVIYIKYQNDGQYRPLVIPKGSKLCDIEQTFMQLFADIIPEESKFLDFKFHLVHGNTMVPIKNDYEFQPNDYLVVYFGLVNFLPPYITPHAIEDGVDYYMWSMFSQTNEGLMKRDGANVKCDGKKSDQPALIQFTANDVTSGSSQSTAFTLPSNNSKVYVIKGVGENQDLIVEEVDNSFIKPSMGDEYKFQCDQSFSYMQYRCIGVGSPKRTDLYISAHQDGTVQLQKAGVRGYPTPSTLFIAVNMN